MVVREMRLFEGVRVLDLSRMLAGPYGSMLLADMGAEVIKIDDPDGGDPMRVMGPPFLPDGESAYFLATNRNKKSVALDLAKEAGREVFYDLVRQADVVWENFRPGVMERLGGAYSRLWSLNQRVILCSISAYGQEGPYRDWPAFDLALQAMGGAMSITGEPGRPPVRMGLPMGDLAGGIFGAFAVAGALFRRERTGEGSYIDLSLLDCQVSLLTYIAQYFWANGRVPEPLGSGHASVVPYQALAARDGHLIVAVFAEKFWSGFCRVVEHPEWEHDLRFKTNRDRVANRDVLAPLIEAAFGRRTTDDWLARLQAEGVPCAPIRSVDRVLADPQVRRRGMVVEMAHPVHGKLPALGMPVKVDGAMGLEVPPPPKLGEHTDAARAPAHRRRGRRAPRDAPGLGLPGTPLRAGDVLRRGARGRGALWRGGEDEARGERPVERDPHVRAPLCHRGRRPRARALRVGRTGSRCGDARRHGAPPRVRRAARARADGRGPRARAPGARRLQPARDPRVPSGRVGLAGVAEGDPVNMRVLLLLLALAVLAGVPARAEQGVTDAEILLGGSNSLSGPLAFTGEQMTKFGVDLYLKVVNDAGGIHGRK